MAGGAGERNEAVKRPEIADFKKNDCVSKTEVSRENMVAVVGFDR